MKLSICMMVKNEEKFLDNCLKSLIPLMNQIDSELIIVDTGSEDKTVEIAKKYTDKIYFHKWNNNFSEMRNITISYAKGEWILIIDADEELEDEKEIVDFLLSKESSEYNSATIFVKNILKQEGDQEKSSIIRSHRLFRNDGTFKYEGSVHNLPVYKLPTKELKTILNHYGYMISNKELIKKKFYRTSALLKAELEKNPENIYYRFQLAISYQMNNDIMEALNEIIKAYNIMKEKKLNPREYLYIYFRLANLYFVNKMYDMAEKICLEGIEIENEYIDLYFVLAKCQLILNRINDSIKNYKIYLDLLQKYHSLKIKDNPLVEMFCLDLKNEAYNDLAIAYFNLKDYRNSIKYAEKIEVLEDSIKIKTTSLLKINDIKGLYDYYKFSINKLQNEYKELFFRIVEKQYNEIAEKNDKIDYLNRFINGFADVDEAYIKLSKIRYYFNVQSNHLQDSLNEFYETESENFIYFDEYYADIIYYLIYLERPIYKIFSNLPEVKINQLIEYIKQNYNDFELKILNYVEIYDKFQELIDKKILKILLRTLLISGKIDENNYKITFEKYINVGIKYIESIYNEEIIEKEMIYEMKNKEDAFLLFIRLAYKVKNFDKLQYIRYLRKALNVFPAMKKGIEILLNEIDLEEKTLSPEMENLKQQFINNINILLDCGNYDDAQELIEQVEEIIGKDIDIVMLKTKLKLAKTKENKLLN